MTRSKAMVVIVLSVVVAVVHACGATVYNASVLPNSYKPASQLLALVAPEPSGPMPAGSAASMGDGAAMEEPPALGSANKSANRALAAAGCFQCPCR
jgi:hypothetical protein